MVGAGFDFVEASFVGVVEAHQDLIVRPTEAELLAQFHKGQSIHQFARQCLAN